MEPPIPEKNEKNVLRRAFDATIKGLKKVVNFFAIATFFLVGIPLLALLSPIIIPIAYFGSRFISARKSEKQQQAIAQAERKIETLLSSYLALSTLLTQSSLQHDPTTQAISSDIKRLQNIKTSLKNTFNLAKFEKLMTEVNQIENRLEKQLFALPTKIQTIHDRSEQIGLCNACLKSLDALPKKYQKGEGLVQATLARGIINDLKEGPVFIYKEAAGKTYTPKRDSLSGEAAQPLNPEPKPDPYKPRRLS